MKIRVPGNLTAKPGPATKRGQIRVGDFPLRAADILMMCMLFEWMNKVCVLVGGHITCVPTLTYLGTLTPLPPDPSRITLTSSGNGRFHTHCIIEPWRDWLRSGEVFRQLYNLNTM